MCSCQPSVTLCGFSVNISETYSLRWKCLDWLLRRMVKVITDFVQSVIFTDHVFVTLFVWPIIAWSGLIALGL